MLFAKKRAMRAGRFLPGWLLLIVLVSTCAVDPTDKKLVGEIVPHAYRCNAFDQECTIRQGDLQIRYRAFNLGENKYRIEGHVKQLAGIGGSSVIQGTLFVYCFVKNNVILAVGPRFSIIGGADTAFKKEITGPEQPDKVLGNLLEPDNILVLARLRRIGQY